MKGLIATLVIILSIQPALGAESYPVKSLVKTTRAKTNHWWQTGEKVYIYSLDGSDKEYWSSKLLENIPDERPESAKHPYKHAANKFRNGCEWASPIISVSMAIFWPLITTLKKGL